VNTTATTTERGPRTFDPCSVQYEKHQHDRCRIAYRSAANGQIRVCDCPRHTEQDIRRSVRRLESGASS
jgi:hypothetical protein